jgi:hypothetical protein
VALCAVLRHIPSEPFTRCEELPLVDDVVPVEDCASFMAGNRYPHLRYGGGIGEVERRRRTAGECEKRPIKPGIDSRVLESVGFPGPGRQRSSPSVTPTTVCHESEPRFPWQGARARRRLTTAIDEDDEGPPAPTSGVKLVR